MRQAAWSTNPPPLCCIEINEYGIKMTERAKVRMVFRFDGWLIRRWFISETTSAIECANRTLTIQLWLSILAQQPPARRTSCGVLSYCQHQTGKITARSVNYSIVIAITQLKRNISQSFDELRLRTGRTRQSVTDWSCEHMRNTRYTIQLCATLLFASKRLKLPTE